MTRDLVPRSLVAELEELRAQDRPWEPEPFQERAVRFLLEHAQSGLLLDPGLRKTSATLAAILTRVRKRQIRRALVVAPLRVVHETWPQEMRKWREFHELGVAVVHGPGKDAVLRALEPGHQVVLMNFEGLLWLTQDKARLRALDADMLVIDESSKIKNGTSQRFRALRPLLGRFRYRHILTGSPRPRHYLDLWAQVYILDQGASLGAWITHYRNRYFYPCGWQMREWELIPGKEAEINRAIAPLVLRLDAKDHVKMPAEMEDVRRFDLPPEARREYDALEKNLMSELFRAPLVSGAAARSKLCQIANGAVYLDTERGQAKRVHKAKVEALQELVEELQGEPLLVAVGFRHDTAAIREALGRDVPCMDSAATARQINEYKTAWNAGRLPLLLAHPASVGHGINMQECGARHVCFFDLPDDYDLFDQFFRRVWRSGNRSPFVVRHLLVGRRTVDEAKLRNLRRKGRGQNAFLAAMKEYAREKGL